VETATPPYQITELDNWAAIVEADADGDGANGPVLEIRVGSELQALPNPSREAMLGAVANFGGSLLGLRTPAQIQERAAIAADVFEVLLKGNSRQIEALIEALTSASPQSDGVKAEEIDLSEAEARARLRMKATFRKVLDESLTVSQLRDEFKLSRQRLKQLRDDDRLFAIEIPYHRGMVYPAWQFDPSGRPLTAMQALIRAARNAHLDALGFHLLMTGRREGGRSGVQLLRDGREDLALSLVRGADR
jgi:hypothetical protein